MTLASACTDLNGNTLNCTLTSYQAVAVSLPNVPAGVQYGVIISNIRNPPSYRPTASNFTLTTKTADLISIYAQGTIAPNLANSLPSSFTALSYSFTPAAYADG